MRLQIFSPDEEISKIVADQPPDAHNTGIDGPLFLSAKDLITLRQVIGELKLRSFHSGAIEEASEERTHTSISPENIPQMHTTLLDLEFRLYDLDLIGELAIESPIAEDCISGNTEECTEALVILSLEAKKLPSIIVSLC